MKLIRPDWSKSTYCPQCDRITIVELDDESPICSGCDNESIEAETQHEIATIRQVYENRIAKSELNVFRDDLRRIEKHVANAIDWLHGTSEFQSEHCDRAYYLLLDALEEVTDQLAIVESDKKRLDRLASEEARG